MASQLRSSVLVELTVLDINEKPSCTIESTNLNIKVDEAVGTPIVLFSCRDPDVKEEYNTLTYDISGSSGMSALFCTVNIYMFYLTMNLSVSN